MRDTLDPLLKQLPPKTKTALVAAINACAKQLNLGPEWVQRWLSFTIVADALASYAPNGSAVFELKGGAALELRLHQLQRSDTEATAALRPRATKDLDIAFHGDMEALREAVERALARPRHGFAFRTELETQNAPNMRRFRVHVSYLEQGIMGIVARAVSNVKLEVSVYEGTRYPADQVVLLRNRHVWPPTIMVHETWVKPVEQRANDMGLPVTTADAIIGHVNGYVMEIVSAR